MKSPDALSKAHFKVLPRVHFVDTTVSGPYTLAGDGLAGGGDEEMGLVASSQKRRRTLKCREKKQVQRPFLSMLHVCFRDWSGPYQSGEDPLN